MSDEKQIVKNSMDLVQSSPELAQMYNDNASLGADNLGASLPLLKVHSTGKSTTNELADGSEPNNGWFFYAPTQEQFESVTCHILAVSRGFYSKGMEQKGKEEKEVFNQLVAGVIMGNEEDKAIKPFIMYLTGNKLSRFWEFGKAAAKYTKAKPIAIPLFALNVKMTTKAIPTDFGKAWVVNFEILKDEDTKPVLVTDPGEFVYLRDHVATMQETLEGIISAKEIGSSDEDVPMPTEEPR